VASTRQTLDVLENMFSLNIDSSDSGISILPSAKIKKIKDLSKNPLFVVSSKMRGEMWGSLTLLMSSSDFKNLGEALKPTLKLLFLSNPDADLSTLERQTPGWMKEGRRSHLDDDAFFERMVDTSTELGNVLFGIYTNAIYEVFDIHTHHSLPEFSPRAGKQHIQDILSSLKLLNKQHLVIQNNFTIFEKYFNLWCLISPSKRSLKTMLNRVG